MGGGGYTLMKDRILPKRAEKKLMKMNDENCLKIRWFGNSALIVVLYTIDDVHRVRRSRMVEWIWLKKEKRRKIVRKWELWPERRRECCSHSVQWSVWWLIWIGKSVQPSMVQSFLYSLVVICLVEKCDDGTKGMWWWF